MAKIPTPRSFNQILGDMIDAFLSRFGLKSLKVGSPVLSIMEAAAQSDLRSSQDIFDLLNAQSLDRATGLALDRIGADEDLPRQTEAPSSGVVTISDSRFTRIATKVYQGKPAPIVGSSVLYVTDASKFPASGSLYIGRGTTNYEGPLAYSAKVFNGTYWTLTLTDNTRKFHNLSEPVVLAQGGNRVINAGTLVQTPQGNTTDAVQFSTLFPATIPDGEVEITGVQVIAQKPGVTSNVSAKAISAFVAPPFTGASVTNPLPFTNGLPAWDDATYREAIKAVRQSRSKGTPLALTTAIQGTIARDENKRVASAAVVSRQGFPTTVYIDDGTGYEERSQGVPLETLMDRASGGEQFFQVTTRPLAKAHLVTTNRAPFKLRAASKLAVSVGGVTTEHTFDAESYRNIENASAYEIAANINADHTLGWGAATYDSGQRVRLFAKDDENEDIEIDLPSGLDANEDLLFPVGRQDTMRLYRNDRLLSKDGKLAVLRSNPTAMWGVLSSGETLQIAVDGTAPITYTFVDQDFIDAGTGYATVGRNSVDAWVQVLNAKLVGVTTNDVGGLLALTSNAGRQARAKLSITGGSLVTKQVFVTATATGEDRDYTLDRNTGQIRLEVPLNAGDSLAAGTVKTRAFLESSDLSTVTLNAPGGKLYFVIDGAAQIVKTGIAAGLTIRVDHYNPAPDTTWGERVTYTAMSGTPFTNVQVGDWMIFQDAGFSANNLGAWRVAYCTNTVVEVERTAWTNEQFPLTASDSMVFVRTTKALQVVTIPAGTNYTAASVVTELNSRLVGAQAEVFRTKRIRVRTNTFGPTGDVALVAANFEGKKLTLPIASATVNTTAHLAAVESGTTEIGTPVFNQNQLASVTDTNTFRVENLTGINEGSILVFTRDMPDPDGLGYRSRWGSNTGFTTGIDQLNSGTGDIDTRLNAVQEFLPKDRLYAVAPWALGPQDDLVVVADQDDSTKRFQIPIWRKLKPVGAVYGLTNSFKDADNGNVTLVNAFGQSFDFQDFAIYMAARTETHAADATKRILWRYKRLGPDGERARVRYSYPTAPASGVSVSTDAFSTGTTDISVKLASAAAKTGYPITAGARLGMHVAVAGRKTLTVLLGFSVALASRTAGISTLDLTLPAGVTAHGYQVGDQFYLKSTDPNFTSGVKTITSVAPGSIYYADAAPDIGATASIGTVSSDTAEATFTGIAPAIVIGDIASAFGTAFRITAFGNQFLQGYADDYAPGAGITWLPLITTSNLAIFPLGANTATSIAAAVNALDAKCPIKATVTGTGAGTIALSSNDEAAAAGTWFQLSDGVNWVRSVTYPVLASDDYSFTFKRPITAGIAANSDWANEDVRLVPTNAATLSRWLNSQAVTGLSSVALISNSDGAKRLQLASLTAGSGGAIQVQGGSANGGAASITGSAAVVGSYAVVTVPASDGQSFFAGMWLSADNAETTVKNSINAATALTSINSSGLFTVNSQPVWAYSNAGPITGKTWRVEKQRRFVAYSYSIDTYGAGGVALGATAEGDRVKISGGTANSLNTGTFRIVRTFADSHIITFWVENPVAVEEDATMDVALFTADSMMPGDKLSISTTAWGAGNQGVWTIVSTPTAFTFQVDGATVAQGPVAALGSALAPLIKVIEGQPARLIKQIHTVSPNQTDATFLDIKLTTNAQAALMSEAAGTVLRPLDRLDFPVDISVGADGYQFSTGLIGEASRVLYGDPKDPATYPGYVAAGARVNVSGPLVKRITVALSLRVRSGISSTDIRDRVRSAVASVVNKTGLGQPVAISDIVTAAGKVNGVIAVSILAPTYSASSDLIPVQPQEKPLILNLEQDITISFVGE